jgi:hypothetical protein
MAPAMVVNVASHDSSGGAGQSSRWAQTAKVIVGMISPSQP